MGKYSWKYSWVVVALLACGSLQAANLMFLRNAPISNLDGEDRRFLKEAAVTALESEEDGETVSWRNAGTGHFGEITVLDTHRDYDTVCRTVRFFIAAGDKTGRSVFRACKADDDTWRLAPNKQ